MIKKYSFLIFIVLLAAGLFAASALIAPKKDEKYIYSPQINLVKPAPTVSAKPEAAKAVKRTDLVYFYDNAEVFHIEVGCCGMDRIPGRPCGQALDKGLRPCSVCMKDITVQQTR